MEEIAKTQKQLIRERMLALMIEKFPSAFSIEEGKIKPLKIGINTNITQILGKESIEKLKEELCVFLKWYVRRAAYHKAMVNSCMRIDLQGNEVEPITDEHKQHAKKKLWRPKPKENNTNQNKGNKDAKENTEEYKPATAAPVSSIEVSYVKIKDVQHQPIENLEINVNSLKPKLSLKKGLNIVVQ